MSDIDAMALAKNYLRVVEQAGIEVERAYLFGSFAKGKTWEGSDVDVCIISPQFGVNYFEEKSRLNKLALKIDSRIEPVLFNPSDFGNKYDPLVAEIKRFGIQI
ncbi:nucleotidyltransferase domain-containing protein [Candidatus Collierbacteria bacterium]|nr:nucleotidyltransferase domain-containing protein [Candidatus Collierbacteria bacterium]